MRLRTLAPDNHVHAERDATPEAVWEAFTPAQLWYGTEVELLPRESAAPCLNAVAVTGPYAGPRDAGEFLLGFEEGGTCYSEAFGRRFTRDETVAYFVRCLAGDRAWIEDFAWAEIVEGRSTGRLRDRAI